MIGIDLYCGAGGMSLGFEEAGFTVVAAVDSDPRATRAFQSNFPTVPTLLADARALTGDDIRDSAALGRQHMTVVFGGPPCQGFSVGGRQHANDPRNGLLLEFARLVVELRPSYFVMENVPGLASDRASEVFRTCLDYLTRRGYRIVEPIRILNARDFGVPQSRRRLFVLGYQADQRPPEYPVIDAQCPEADRRFALRPTVWDAMGDLPDADAYDELLHTDAAVVDFLPPSAYAAYLRGERNGPPDGSKTTTKRLLTASHRTRHLPRTRRRFQQTKPGEYEPVSRFLRLQKDGLAPTLRAGTGPEAGSYTAPRPIHPSYPRCITVREAARLHSFPDWFGFDHTIWHGFRQVGNSVPPLLARALASRVAAAAAVP